MHRVINKTPDGMDTDHIDSDKLNNQKSNLRNCSRGQNCQRASGRNRGTSKYMGVHWSSNEKKWKVQIRDKISGKKLNLGTYLNEIYAAGVYDKKAIELHGEFAYLNFPMEVEL